MIRFHEFPAAAQAAAAQAGTLAERLRQLLTTRTGPAVVALSGGRSPIPFFDALSRQQLDWPRVELRLVDERLVAPDHAHSNERLLREHLLQRHATAARFVGLVPADLPITATPEQLAIVLERANAWHAPLDLLVLGMGADGHVASLFPSAPEYAGATGRAASARYALLHPDPNSIDPAVPRISLTLPALLVAKRWQLTLSGEPKRACFEQAQGGGANAELPISLLLANLSPGAEFDVYWHP